ncbi:GNAT family N-acetyltransferase [Sinorhizobium fredii]|uniref:N-acetyltransferase n=2 Tax=Rhizobium fredii TaxID=380 RepID=A0A2A6LZF6_RHIFR|nr:GNAT family N-acetyltransferase [Sinorhizobium fredii]KSV90272.1 GNAT family acetyltransferase [Sinorhizobium fredii USDA 205]MCG5474039.1 GNAT family N-acetyltransferase [Sinorhizobium fredii]MQW93891.1 GNAT family N-acetyltransferase [Sinorhizobium fredii]MQX09760.1 GNAT family N-acetyltransferase [Sinorhizobium fredii]PDT47616.1 N-acetyltransferase [Sinorhizobium fredii]
MHRVPVIETERLLLRPYRRDDFPSYSALFADEQVTRYVGGVPYTREQSWTRFLRQVGMWHYFGFGFFAIQEKEGGAFIGEAGFHDPHRQITPSLEGTMEMGWALSPRSHGRGLASEAVSAALAWGDREFPALRKTCIIEPGNEASIRVALKHGFREFWRTTYHGRPMLMLERRSTGAT